MGTQTDFLALPSHIIKRDGVEVPFEVARIESALLRAGQASGEFGALEATGLAAQVIKVLAHRFGEGRVPDVEGIQDVVEQTLISANYLSTARAYIIYREQRHKLRTDQRTLVDVSSSIDEYLDRSDWRVAANANQGYSLGGLILNTSGKMIANYWLNHVYPPEIGEAHREGDFHIHDLDMLAGYCFTGDTRVALLDGTTPTLKELALTKAHESFWVYSRDSEGNVVPGKAHSPRLTRKNVDVVAVIISGGHTIKCTPDHEFMLRDGTYKKASALRQDDSLSPLYVSQIGSGYLRLSDAKLKLREYVHRIIASCYYGDLTGKSVHHINGNKTDNRPENLRVMDDADHRRMELCATTSGQVWRAAQTARLNEYNRSDSKRETISQFAKTRERDSGGRFYNHTVRCAPQFVGQEDVYCLTVEDYENFALADGVFVHNCAGWSLRTLLNEGLNGVPGKVEANPPKHMSSAIGQIVNFLGTLQNEWAGAQAFSSFDTYMAPFVRVDGLDYRHVKQAIQELIYNLNVPSRWGCQCVDEETECLTEHGWKRYDQIGAGERIATFDWHNNCLEYLEPLALNSYDFDGEMYVLRNRTQEQWITPGHKVLRKVFNTENRWILEDIETVAQLKSPIIIPNAWETAATHEIDEHLICDLDVATVRTLSAQQIRRFLDTAPNFELLEHKTLDLMQELCVLAGYGSCVQIDEHSGRYSLTIIKNNETEIQSIERHPYKGKVWCPTTRNGTFVARRHGKTFITGNTPFTNLTFDWVCPEDLRNQVPVIAGVEQPFTYGELQAEMDLINRAYIEVMTEGDAKGRIFTFPIPTYNITSDFPWEGKNTDLLFGMTAKYGLPYFCLEENTLLFTRQGIKAIKEITLADEVIGSDGQYKPVKHVMSTAHSANITLTTETGCKIICSENHCFPTAAGLKKAADLSLSDTLRTGDGTGAENITTIERQIEPTNMIDLEIDSADHLFLLANGILTHNSNFVSSDMDPHMVRSMCCRLRLDVSELLKRGNGLFGSAEQTGSLGVVTINCARLGFTHRGDERGLLARLDTLMELARNSLEIKRKIIQRHMDSGLFPYTKRYLGTLRNHFSTIGVNGVNEMIRNFTQDAEDITTVRGHQIACRLLDHVRSRMIEFQELTGSMYNLEATPAEGTTYRFAREDQKRFPSILQAGTKDAPYYTNSSQLPVGYTDDPFEALAMQETLQSKYTGGTVLHLYMSEQLSSAEACKRLVRRALENFRLPYVTVTPVFSICPKHGYIAGEHHFCPLCDQELIARKQAEHNRTLPRLDFTSSIHAQSISASKNN
jgi:anaerobic ribonucleoside-triphosphate reductase